MPCAEKLVVAEIEGEGDKGAVAEGEREMRALALGDGEMEGVGLARLLPDWLAAPLAVRVRAEVVEGVGAAETLLAEEALPGALLRALVLGEADWQAVRVAVAVALMSKDTVARLERLAEGVAEAEAGAERLKLLGGVRVRDWEADPDAVGAGECVEVEPSSKEAEAEAEMDGESVGVRVETALEAVKKAVALLQRVGAATEGVRSAEALLQALRRELAVPVPVEPGE